MLRYRSSSRLFCVCLCATGLQTTEDVDVQLLSTTLEAAAANSSGNKAHAEEHVDTSLAGRAKQRFMLSQMKLRVWLLEVVFGWVFWWKALLPVFSRQQLAAGDDASVKKPTLKDRVKDKAVGYMNKVKQAKEGSSSAAGPTVVATASLPE